MVVGCSSFNLCWLGVPVDKLCWLDVPGLNYAGWCSWFKLCWLGVPGDKLCWLLGIPVDKLCWLGVPGDKLCWLGVPGDKLWWLVFLEIGHWYCLWDQFKTECFSTTKLTLFCLVKDISLAFI